MDSRVFLVKVNHVHAIPCSNLTPRVGKREGARREHCYSTELYPHISKGNYYAYHHLGSTPHNPIMGDHSK